MALRHGWRFFLIVAALFTATGISPSAAGYDEGKHAYDKGDFQKALNEWLPLARGGDARSQNRVAGLYAGGEGVPRNYHTAIDWYRKAADQGLAAAQNSLGLIYEDGPQDIAPDPALAVAWYRKAAAQKDADGLRALANMYEYALGVPHDRVIAYALFSLSAMNSYYAQALLPRMTGAQKAAGETLARKLQRSGSFLQVLDAAARKNTERKK